MKSKENVLEKANELIDKYRTEARQEYLSKSPKNCVHNSRFRVKSYGKIGFCQCQKECDKNSFRLLVCDAEIPSDCVSYQCRNSEKDVDEKFDEVIRNPAMCGSKFPKLAALIWCLQEYDSPDSKGRLKELFSIIGKASYKVITFKWKRKKI
jgi:hypothetical protein